MTFRQFDLRSFQELALPQSFQATFEGKGIFGPSLLASCIYRKRSMMAVTFDFRG